MAKLAVITTSGSLETRLCASSSKKRLRTYSDSSDLEHPPLPVTTPRPTRRLPSIVPANAFVRCILLVYASFSLLFATYTFYQGAIAPTSGPATLQLDARKMARVVQTYATPSGFHPYFHHDPHPQLRPTAALWCGDDTSLEDLAAWSRVWAGPLSIVMTTSNSTSTASLRTRLAPLRHVSVHLLSASGMPPNALLNLARIYAQTKEVVIFPLPSSLLDTDIFPISKYLRSPDSSRPALLTNSSRPMLNFDKLPPFVPLVIQRDYSAWCPERFFYKHEPALDWNECVWRIWLETLGRVEQISGIGATLFTRRASHEQDALRSRLISRYRSEACDLAIKRQTVLEPPSTKQGQHGIQWLRHFCKQTTASIYKMN
ncbi:hypothetical protein CYLTODRAFT_491093 [Cylindrobasidium torrendii FP15055 ss-10]|uniref:Uncharacterized protein n=1 Tax=Cylindrobasidium torrendii FP15055 ss-10 TaxID=1314674 RepID=A0A0D7B9N3_9AGAR|nr:hypothetical protein CYLTODRAFT_491093 [Cylindrobasidium torrendii FP15055 ss-10]